MKSGAGMPGIDRAGTARWLEDEMRRMETERQAPVHPIIPGLRLVGPNQAVEILGVMYVGVNAENGKKILLALAPPLNLESDVPAG